MIRRTIFPGVLGMAAVMTLFAADPVGLAQPGPSPAAQAQEKGNEAPAGVVGPAASVTNAVPAPETITAEKAWRSFIEIQGQLDTALLAIERSRRQNEATTIASQKLVEDGLKSIDKVLHAQEEREVQALQESNRHILLVAGAFAGVGFLAMLLTSFFHLRTMNRLAGLAGAFPLPGMIGLGRSSLLSPPEERLLSMSSGGQSGQRLLTAIEKLEKRVYELEHTPGGGNLEAPLSHAGTTELVIDAGVPKAGEPGPEEAPVIDSMAMLLGKGQALLNLAKFEEALDCFESILSRHPGHGEAQIKKGIALEKLNRLEEAIVCYDRAIDTNPSMTLAYLYKGGLCNRMEKYDEALACYEQALKTQHHS